MSKKESRFNTFKANNPRIEEVKTIQDLKNSILQRAEKMIKNKQINKAVFNKLEKLTYSRTRRATLEETLETLKQIRKDIKSGKKTEGETPNNKITLKGLKEQKNNFKIDNNTKFNVYIKYETYTRTEFKQDGINVRFLDEIQENKQEQEGTKIITIDGTKIKTIVKISHETIVVKGKKNIPGELKDFIRSLMEYPYILKVKIIHVAINKMMIQDDVYRYQGAKRSRSSKGGFRYFKAWDASFTYHKYDLDINNETPFECVPNALFKMYGDRSKKGYLASIANGGLDYIKNKLDSYNIVIPESDASDLDFGLDMEPEKSTTQTGYTPAQILEFCNEHKLRCFGYDWKMEQFITNKFSDVKYNKDNLPAFVFYLNDQHIYLIQDKEMRHALLHSHDKSHVVSLLSKQKELTSEEWFKKQMKTFVDMPFSEWDNVDNATIYITQNRVVHDAFYKLVCQGEVYNKKLKMNEKEGVVRFKYKTNTIIYNPDYYPVMKTLERLDNTKYTFSNQRLNSLAKEYFEKEFGGVMESTMNQEGDDIFQSDNIRNCMFNGWLSKPEKSENLCAYDYNKHYTDCLKGNGAKFGWCIYNVFDEVKIFDGVIKAGYFFVETQNFFPFRGNGWYDADLVHYAVEEGIIKKSDIKFMYCAARVLPPNHFAAFVDGVYTIFENPKSAINKYIGCFGHDFKNKNIHHFTTDSRNVFAELVENPDAKVKYVYHDEFTNDNNNNRSININKMNINDYLTTSKPVCYHVYNDKRIKLFHNSLPIFYKIYSLSAIKMHKMSQQLFATVRAVLTDTIIFEGHVSMRLSDGIGGIRKTETKPFTHLLNTTPRDKSYTLTMQDFTPITEFKLEDNKGVFISGMAGCGKSYTINKLKEQLQPHEYKVCSPTLKSALIVNGATIYSLFNINPHDHSYLKSALDKMKKEGVKWIFIDEISMINSKLWACLRDFKKIYGFKFVLTGDFAQLPPVEDIQYDVRASQVFKELCDGQILELTRNYRAEKCPEFKTFNDDLLSVREGKKIHLKNYGDKECRKSLCWTNKTRKAINNEWMFKEAKGKECYIIGNKTVFVGLPLICNISKCFNEDSIRVANNEEFTVVKVDSKTVDMKNDRINLTIPHVALRFFDLAYCLTVHKSQGSTYDFEYSIYEYFRFDKKLLYTAMSRATNKKSVNFVNKWYKTHEGYIYKITSPIGKIYIGSTTTSIEQRFKEHKESKDESPLHTDMKIDTDNWTIETVSTVEYTDEQELLIVEASHIMGCDSITHGYNTKFPIDFHTIH